ncbi:hypothetical protein [Sphingomonas sp. RB1R13]|uniref:hypothetical protein n=1 Tax=Sphingomonas sp. RB1R13 TaxID=3096159 RepID=UPI002FCC10DB
MSCKVIGIALAALLLAGCNTTHSVIGSEDKRFGEAVKYDLAIQTINPDPVYAADGAQPGDSGAQAAAATKRYRTDAVKKIEEIKTSNSTNGSGSSSK